MSIITRKIEVYICEEDKDLKKQYKDTVYEWARLIQKASNIVMAARFEMLGICQTLEFIEEGTRVKVEQILKEGKGMSKQNVTLRILSELFKGKIHSHIYGPLNQQLAKKFDDIEYKIRKGEVSVPSFKLGCPIPFRSNDIKLNKADDGKFYFTLYGIPFACRLGRDKSNNAAIIDGVLSGLYKLSTSSIKIDGKDMYLLLCVNIPKKEAKLDKKTVVGLDLGINVPVYAAVNNSMERKAFGSREQFFAKKIAFEKRRRALQHSISDAQGGKGRSHKLRALENLREAERNWTKTMNHTYSHQAVEWAVKQGAGVIQLEDLTGYGKRKRKNTKAGDEATAAEKYITDKSQAMLLRNWSYFELQTMIEYKAKQYGIRVLKIKPAYTSQKCCYCGGIGYRDPKDKTKFYCTNPQCEHYLKEEHADYNGAKNISLSTEYVTDEEIQDAD